MNSKPTHTPGPWHINPVSDSRLSFQVGAVNDRQASGLVCRAYGNNPDHAEANARLIASAPELLAALDIAAAAVYEFTRSALIEAGHTRGINGSAGKIALENPIYIQARAALSKAGK